MVMTAEQRRSVATILRASRAIGLGEHADELYRRLDEGTLTRWAATSGYAHEVLAEVRGGFVVASKLTPGNSELRSEACAGLKALDTFETSLGSAAA